MSREEQKRIYLQPAGLSSLGIALKHTLDYLFLGPPFAIECRKALHILALTTMLPDVITEVEGEDKKTDDGLRGQQNHISTYTLAQETTKKQQGLNWLNQRNLEIYGVIMRGLAAHGITQKKLEECGTNMPDLDSFK